MTRTNLTISIDAEKRDQVRDLGKIHHFNMSQKIEKLFEDIIKQYSQVEEEQQTPQA